MIHDVHIFSSLHCVVFCSQEGYAGHEPYCSQMDIVSGFLFFNVPQESLEDQVPTFDYHQLFSLVLLDVV